MMASARPRLTLAEITRRYDRIAPYYRFVEPLFGMHAGVRRRAVAALDLRPGDRVLEVGCGTGRNFPYLAEAIGSRGHLVGVDASAGMLAEARSLIRRHGWVNIQLLEADGSTVELRDRFDAVLFSLSYSVLPEPVPAAETAWDRLRPGGRLVLMDLGLRRNWLGRLLAPVAGLLFRLAPGDPDSRPWDDLAHLGPSRTERFFFGLFYLSSWTKPIPYRQVAKAAEAPLTTRVP
jgi:ubiquinone/menaquinone biosynthesis C-methylase UbiE